jgi:hypothetical protein
LVRWDDGEVCWIGGEELGSGGARTGFEVERSRPFSLGPVPNELTHREGRMKHVTAE